ncbi:hypothetical protein GP486_008048 [Trichoglossum hirsutum]|uniref:Uncharacterized protein n=1 Tax=Trichoglossum hirsutum TaxID=265104 RepID=A0A9P8L6H3_9PEZI|nr:hypothetical protein GP486_008048 [Trichoglossum hirsutum]
MGEPQKPEKSDDLDHLEDLKEDAQPTTIPKLSPGLPHSSTVKSDETLHRPHSEPTSSKTSRRAPIRTSTLSSSMRSQGRQTPQAQPNRLVPILPAVQPRQPSPAFSRAKLLPGWSVSPHMLSEWQLPSSHGPSPLRGQQQPQQQQPQQQQQQQQQEQHHHDKPQKQPPLSSTSAVSETPHAWDPIIIQPQPMYQYQFLTYQDQTTLVIGLLGYVERLMKECEEMRAFIHMGYNAQESDGARFNVEGYVAP